MSTSRSASKATGELQAKDRALIASEVDGVVTELAVDEGDRVEEGAVVLEIDPEKRALVAANVRAMQRDAQAALAEAQREVARMRKLHEGGIASDAALDEAETRASLARSRVDATGAELGVAERALRDASVRAPFAGLSRAAFVSRGEYVQPGEPLFELVALDPIEVEFHLTERDSARVARRPAGRGRVAPYPGRGLPRRRCTLISPTDRPDDAHAARARRASTNAEGALRPGLFARADLGVAMREGVLMVPEEAVLQRADGAVVFVVATDNRVERRRGEARRAPRRARRGRRAASRAGDAGGRARPARGSSTAPVVALRSADGDAVERSPTTRRAGRRAGAGGASDDALRPLRSSGPSSPG